MNDNIYSIPTEGPKRPYLNSRTKLTPERQKEMSDWIQKMNSKNKNNDPNDSKSTDLRGDSSDTGLSVNNLYDE